MATPTAIITHCSALGYPIFLHTVDAVPHVAQLPLAIVEQSLSERRHDADSQLCPRETSRFVGGDFSLAVVDNLLHLPPRCKIPPDTRFYAQSKTDENVGDCA